MYSFLLALLFSQPPVAPGGPGLGNPGGGGAPPTQALARIDAKGTIAITQVNASPAIQSSFTYATLHKEGTQQQRSGMVLNRVVSINVTELAVELVKAYDTDGKPIPADRLAVLLDKERQVLLATDGQKVDPFYLKLIKDGTVVLVPPAGVCSGGGYAYGGHGPIMAVPPTPVRDIDETRPTRTPAIRRAPEKAPPVKSEPPSKDATPKKLGPTEPAPKPNDA